MALTLTQTAVGPLYMSGASTGTAVAFGMAGGTQVFTMDRGSPATIGTINSVYKYYAAAINFSSPAELRIDLQVSTNNTLWKDLDSVSRYIGKDTLNIKDIVGSFQFPSAAYAAPLEITAYRYLAISMRLVGVPSYDSNGTIISNATLATNNTLTIVCGLSLDTYSATSASQVSPHVVIPNRPLY